jgi:hypothetical protein
LYPDAGAPFGHLWHSQFTFLCSQALVEFVPPDLFFAFQLRIPIPLFPRPKIELSISFEFTATVTLGFSLDTKGIREAVEQKAPLKALNSFALIDSFNGVDKAMITTTATIRLACDVSFAIVKVGVSGGLGIRATIDLFDAYPETSKGLVRPFELLSIGSSPLEWFEFDVEIFVTFRIYFKIGIFSGPFKITLYKWTYKFVLIIFQYSWKPSVPTQSGGLDSSGTLNLDTGGETASLRSGTLKLNAGSASISSISASEDGLECTNMAGTVGQETIECAYGDQYQTFYDAKTVKASGAGDILLRGLRSPVDLTAFSVSNVILDYQSAGVMVIADNVIIIQAKEIVAGDFIMRFDGMSGSGLLLLPQPEQAFLTTTFTGQCYSSWVLSGHSNVIVMADQIAQDCSILSYGGNATKAKLTIDFGFEEGRTCQDGNAVILDTDDTEEGQFIRATISRPDMEKDVVVRVGSVFSDVTIKMSTCKDTVQVLQTHGIDGTLTILTGGDNDEIYLGRPEDGLDSLYKSFIVEGGSGEDKFVVDDSASVKNKTTGKLMPGAIVGLLNGAESDIPEDIDCSGVETVDILLSKGSNVFEVWSTLKGSVTTITAQDQNDKITVNETYGDLNIYAGGGDDLLYFYGLGKWAVANVWGEDGDDIIWMDGTNNFQTDPPMNTFGESKLRWSGGNDDDTMHIKLSSLGNTDIDFFDDLDGVNDVNIDCTDSNTVMLSRENFLANIHDREDPASTVERINLIRVADPAEVSGWRDSATINSMVLRLNDGENKMFIDDTFAPINVFGGPSVDGKKKGFGECLFGVPRIACR